MKKLKDFTNEHLDVSQLMNAKEMSKIYIGEYTSNTNEGECINDAVVKLCKDGICKGGSCQGNINLIL